MARSNHICYILGVAINEVEYRVLSLIGPVLIMRNVLGIFHLLVQTASIQCKPQSSPILCGLVQKDKVVSALNTLGWKISGNLI